MRGVDVIKKELESMPSSAGVYRMLGAEDEVLYVGKAKQLNNRVTNYTQLANLSPRIARMVSLTQRMEITVTRTEAEALLLESNLIKSLKPRFNILLRDDKSFPYIALTGKGDGSNDTHPFPRIAKHRGKKKAGWHYFGPYASAGAVNDTIAILQKTFLLRPCSDNEFAKRNRPCMEYQIKRCSGPCVDRISQEKYGELVQQATDFLSGKSHELQQRFNTEMQLASDAMDYEKAAMYRDRIQALSTIQASQSINSNLLANADILALAQQDGHTAIHVFFIRGGQTTGTKSYFPTRTDDMDAQEILEAFMLRLYQQTIPPKHILVSHDIYSKATLEGILADISDHKVQISLPLKGEKRALLEHVLVNAKEALERHLREHLNTENALEEVAKLFDISTPINRIEVYDNSHIFGQHAVGGMIVATRDGFDKNAYRKFNVDSGDKNTGGDDYSMMRQVITRRIKRLMGEEKNTPDAHPQLLLIDGGKGHMFVVQQVMDHLNYHIPFVCIAKGEDRNAGREEFFMTGKDPFRLPLKDPTLYYLQRLRDEAHRFAITTHRNKRAKQLIRSTLDDIQGIGAVRKKALLAHFGSARQIEEATLQELTRAEGINLKVAQLIYDHFHAEI